MKRPACYVINAVFLVLASGCGGGSRNSTDVPFFSGLYQINATSSVNSATIFRLNGNLVKNGNTVSGILHINMPACFSFSTDIPVTGTLGGDAPDFLITLSMTLPSGQMLTFMLSHPQGHQSILNGSYAIAGPGCAGPPQGGAIVDTFDVTGTWRGMFTSSGGTVSQMSLSLTESAPDANGFFSASGNATITGGTCFGAGTVDTNTLILGVGSTVILDGPPGPAGKTTLQGDFTNLPFGGTIFNGTYTSIQGACSDSGTVHMQFP